MSGPTKIIIDNSDETVRSKTNYESISNENKDFHTTNSHGLVKILNSRFELLELIGSGGMGSVYKAIDRRDIEAGNSTFIAIKIINDEYKDDPDLLKALHNEARKTQALAHPNIITVYDFDRDQDTVFMTMEFVDGNSLDNIIRANPSGMPINKALEIITQMSQALIYAHSQHLIHSDFKPNNVLVSQSNQVKIFDFGLARLTNQALSRSFDPGVLDGLTPRYASMEMLNKEEPDVRDDLYALACISYELLSGQHPFNKKNASIAQKNELKPNRLKNLNKKQWKTLKQALAFNRKDRTQDIKTFLEGITSIQKVSPYLIAITSIASVAMLALLFFVFNFDQTEIDNQSSPILTTVDKNILPTENTQQIATTEVIKEKGLINIKTDKSTYTIGDQLQLNFSVDRSLYVRIVTINSLGEIVALFPNPYQVQSFCEPNLIYQIPPKNTGFTLDIAGPKGKDMIIALGSAKPIPDYALNIDKTGKIMDRKLRKTLVQSILTYTIN